MTLIEGATNRGHPRTTLPEGPATIPAHTLASYWHPIGTAADIVDQPRAFRLLGERLVAFRDERGVAVFNDLCIHRGTALSLGTITAGRLTCAYHGWEYDRTGACVHIPSLPPGSTPPRKARAIVYLAEERYGLVWVAMNEPVAPIPSWPDDVWDDPTYHTFLAGHFLWKASAGRIVENAMDVSHFNFVHKGYTELADGPIIKPHAVRRTDYGLHYEYFDSLITREYVLYAPFTIHDKKIQGNADTSYISTFVSPIDSNTSGVYVFIARNHDGAFALQGRGERQSEEHIRAALEVLNAQDQRIVESQRPEQIPVDLREELHLKVPDATGIAYRKLLQEIANSEPFMP
jgi:phenylpropionate dioxygenase-like ring-hydroxylating dioxygenase large terminal subunit